ncbi:microtubule-associated serine/threonine-protein kinase 2-like isoform X3 [Rhopilema esculentum]
MRNHPSLGNSDPSISSSCGDVARKFSTCGITSRRPRSLAPHSPSPPRPSSPGLNIDSSDDFPSQLSPCSTFQNPMLFPFGRSLQAGRRWSVASLNSSGYSTNTPGSSGMSSRTSSQEKIGAHEDIWFSHQFSHDSTLSDIDDEFHHGRPRSPRPAGFKLRSRSLSPTRGEDDISALTNLYNERFPKAKLQMEERLQDFIDSYSTEEININYPDPALNFVGHQIVGIAKEILRKSQDPEANFTSDYFYGVSDAMERLIHEATSKTSHTLDPVQMMVQKLEWIISRPARLLECLGFNPGEFMNSLEMEEQVITEKHLPIDMEAYIKFKLGVQQPIESVPEEGIDGIGGSAEQAPAAPKEVEAKPTENDFEYCKLISNGAYGSVFLVRHKTNRERFALKKMNKHHLMHKNQVQQVFNERDIMTFAENPFVVTLVCTFETRKHLCFLMEYVEGGDCASLLKNMGPLPLDMARLYFAETVLAVEYIHNYGIIHRDLKPDNLLITAIGHIKLTDFGLSKIGLMKLTTNIYEQSAQEFDDVQLFGTPDYIAPEVILRKGYGKPVDWWSMGVILYEFLVGATPFYGSTPQEVFDMAVHADVEFPTEDDALDEEAENMIKALLRKDPNTRLGAGGTHHVKSHIFFNHVNWDSLLRQKAEFVPQLDDDEDTSYFDSREDRYRHELSDEDEDEEELPELGNFSSCSPRYSRILSSSDVSKEEEHDQDLLESGSFDDRVERQDSDSSYGSMRRTDSDTDFSGSESSPRRLSSITSFGLQRIPSPRHPSPLVIDSSRKADETGKRHHNMSEPASPLVKSPSASHLSPRKLHRTVSMPPRIEPTDDTIEQQKTTPIKLDFSPTSDDQKSPTEDTTKMKTRRANVPLSPVRPNHIASLSLKPSIVLSKGAKGFGFTLKAIRVYLGSTNNYTVHHLVEDVDRNGPAFDAGLKPGDLITHVNGEPVQGLQHVEVLSLILTGGRQVKLDATDLSNTSIKRDRKKRALGTRIGSKKTKLKIRSSLSPQDSRRGENEKSRKKSFSWRRIGRSSSMRRSSIKRSKSSAATLVSKSGDMARPQLVLDESGSGATSPGVSGGHASRPSNLHGINPKLSHVVHSPRRKSVSTIPLSPLARPASNSVTSGSSTLSGRSTSPLTIKGNQVLLSPSNASPSKSRLGSPLLRRALSPDRSSRGPKASEDRVKLHPTDLRDSSPHRVLRSRSLKETRSKDFGFK